MLEALSCCAKCLALDGFDLYAVHKLSSKEKKSQRSQDSNPGMLSGKQECYLCATQPREFSQIKQIPTGLFQAELPLDENFLSARCQGAKKS